MMRVKASILLFVTILTSACSVVSNDPWSWLEESSEQTWKNVRLYAIGREIEFSVPDLAKSLGNHVEVWPENGDDETDYGFNFPSERLYEPFTMMASFTWDSWWGGFHKKGGEDFYLSVGISFSESEGNLLDLGLDQRVQLTSDYWLSQISEPDTANRRYREYFTEHLRVEPFVNEMGLAFVEHNAPRVSGEHREFTIPLSDHHVLEFSFYVNKLRYDWEDNPQWKKSRWDLVEKIMKTVRITPDPFGDQPQEIPAQ